MTSQTGTDRQTNLPPFARSAALTLGVELELGLVDPQSMDLAAGAPMLVAAMARDGYAHRVKAEITDAMVEVNTSIHARADELELELGQVMSTLFAYARRFGWRVIGGGTHPFQEWAERDIYPMRRFKNLSRKYGYLAKQFTIFGQHVHVGCASGDDAIYLTHALSQYTPHLIALSAASPYWRSVDTGYQCCRLNIVNVFPLSGIAPALHSWADFERFYSDMRRRDVIESIKDLYWDVRPQPKFGTVEVRVCDTPLQWADAVDIAAFVQALAADLLDNRQYGRDEFYELVYARNRFQACRFGLDGEYLATAAERPITLRQSLSHTLARLEGRFAALGSNTAHRRLLDRLYSRPSAADWLRQREVRTGSLRLVAGEMCDALEHPKLTGLSPTTLTREDAAA